jgi:hypothetical protein
MPTTRDLKDFYYGYDSYDDIPPAERIAQNLFDCWTIELNKIIIHMKHREHIYECTRQIFDDQIIVNSLIFADHRRSPAFRELLIQYLASLDDLLAKHDAHKELFSQIDSDILTEDDIKRHHSIFHNYFLDRSERYWIDRVKNQFEFI